MESKGSTSYLESWKEQFLNKYETYTPKLEVVDYFLIIFCFLSFSKIISLLNQSFFVGSHKNLHF
jgi:hypothetical protein